MADIILTVGFNSSSIAQGIAAINSQFQRGFQPLGRITGAANEFKKSLEASNARVVAFGASAGAIYALRTAFSKLVTSAVEVENSLAEINTLLQVSTKDLARFSSELFRVANATGLSFSEAAKAAQEFARQGISTEQVLQRTKSALTLTRLSGLALEDSVSSLTAAMNSFGKEALTDIEIVNRLANVDAKFAVSSADLAEALKRVAGSAADAGVEFNQVIALVTAAQQATARGGSVIGNSFKTIFTRLQRPQVLDDLESAGVKVRGVNGEALGLISVLENLSNSYDTLSSSQRSFVAEAVGGVYQINVLKSILGDLGSGFGAYHRALEVAGETTSIAQRRMDALNNTISSRLVQTLNTLTKASSGAGEALFGQTIRSGLSGFERILNAKEKLNQLFGGNEDSGVGSFIGGSIGKGISNILSGPLLQGVVFGLIKLFQRLLSFAAESVKDLTGLNQKEKEREAVNKLVVDQLTKQKSIIADIVSGSKSIADGAKIIEDTLKNSNKELSTMAIVSSAIAQVLHPKITAISVKGKTSAKGYIPSLNMVSSEIAGAKDGGYVPGNVLATTVRDGMRSIPIVANSAESKTSVNVGGKDYDFINPPRNSPAGRIHAVRSKMMTGIDPYAARGFIPNLNNEGMGDIVNSMKGKLNNMLTFKEVVSRAERFVTATPEITKRRNDKTWFLDKEFFVSALTNQALHGKVNPKDLEMLQKTMGIDSSLFDVLSDGFNRSINLPELKKRVDKGEFAKGFIPNLAALSPEDAAKAGIQFKKGKNRAYVLGPGEDIGAVEGKDVQFFLRTGDVIDVAAKTLDIQRNGDGQLLKSLWADDRGFVPFELAPTIFNQKLRNKEFGGRYSQSLKGVQGARETTELGKKAISDFRDAVGRTDQIVSEKAERDFAFDPNDVKSMLNLRGREFAGLFAYKDFASKTPLSGAGEAFGKTQIGGENLSVPFTYRGLKDPNPFYQDFKTSINAGVARSLSRLTKLPIKEATLSNEGQSFGIFFDSVMKNYARELGLDIGAKENENIDIVGFKRELTEQFTSQAAFAAADAKGGFNQEAFDNIAEKIARVLAFKKGSGVVTTPVFNDVAKFTGKNAGVFLSDNFTKGAKLDKEGFGVALYKALATGKPFRTNIGSSRSNIISASGGLGNYIKSAADVDKFDEYVLVSTTKLPERVTSELVGLTIGSSSDVVGYKSPKEGDTEHNDVFSTLQKRVGGRFKFASRGFVPNLSAIQDALMRENLATGGNAILDSDPSLITSLNPLGFAAIDKKKQGSAKEAINQHRKLGQSLNSIRGASTGHVPNLAVEDGAFLSNILLATIQSSFGGGELPGVLGKLQKSINNFVGQFDDFNKKAARKQGDWLDTLEQAKKDLLLGNKTSVALPVTPNTAKTKTFTKADDVEAFFAHQTKVTGDRLKAFSEALASEKKKIQSLGFKTAFLGGLLGGGASQIAAGFSPDAAKGVDQFVSGLQLGGQIIATFPSKVGKALGAFSIIQGTIQGLDTFSKGLESAKKQYEVQLGQFQKLSSTLDNLGQSLSSLDNMVLDASVTIETLGKEQRKYSEAIAKLASLGPEGQKIAKDIQQSPDSQGKLRSLADARKLLGQNEESLAGLLQIKDVAAERTVFGKGAGLSGGIFGYRTEIEKTKANQIVQNNAFSSISQLDERMKDVLIKSVSSGAFSDLVSAAEPTKKVIDSIRESGGTENDVKIFVNQVRELLGTEAINKSESVTNARSVALKANERAQFDVDTSSRNELAFRRLFVNAGSLQGNNTLTNRRLNARQAFGQSEVDETRLKGTGAIIGQLFGEQTAAAFEAQISSQRIQAERKQKVDNTNIQTSKNITELFTQGLEGFVKPTDTGKGAEALSDFKQNLLGAINNGISGSLKQGDFTRFVGGNGQLDNEAFEKSIIANSGASQDIQDKLSAFLVSNRGNIEVLKVIEQGNSELVEINQDSLRELQIQNIKLESLRKELDVKRQTNFLGGTRALTDRNFRRDVNRQFIRGARLLETGQTAETRGRGAFQLLDAVKQFGLNPLTIASRDERTGEFKGKGDAQSEQIAKALNAIVNGLKDVQGKQEGRILDSVGRLGNTSSLQILKDQFGSPLKDGAAGVSTSAALKPEGDTIIQQAMSSLESSTNLISGELIIVQNKLKGFGTALDDIKQKLLDAVTNREEKQAEAKQVRETGNKSFNAAEATERKRIGLDSPTSQAENEKTNAERNRFNKSDTAKFGLAGAGLILGILATKSGRQNAGSILKGAKGLVSNLEEPAKKAASATGKFLTKPRELPFGNKPLTEAQLRDIHSRSISAPGHGGPISVVPPTAPRPQIRVQVPQSAIRARDFQLAQKELASREAFARRTQNPGLRAITAKSLQESLTFNPARQVGKTALHAGKHLIKAEGKGALLHFGVLTALGLIAANQAHASTGETAAGGHHPEGVSGVLGHSAKETGLAIGGSLLAAKGLSKVLPSYKPLGGLKGVGASIGIGLVDDLLLSELIPQQKENDKLRLGASFLPPRLQIAARGGIRIGEAVNQGFIGKYDDQAARTNFQTAQLLGANPLAERTIDNSRQIENFSSLKSLSPEASKNRDRIVSEYKNQTNFLRQNNQLNNLSREQLKPLFDELGERINQIRKGEEVGELKNSITEGITDAFTKNLQTQPNGETSATAPQPVTLSIEISLKDADKIPEIFAERVIKPLEQQLKNLQGRTYNVERSVGFTPQPAIV
jgi:TP901 family phage tail tape measure protein